MTDPIVFSNDEGSLGKYDWGTRGMENWMRNHECNDVCKDIPMEADPVLIAKLSKYLKRFTTGKVSEILS